MRLLSCVTENFKKLGSFTAEFTTGLNVVAGDNAQGKSTLLQAIQTALFGATVVPGKKENIPTWGQKTFKITLTFLIHGPDVYTCVRTDKTAKLTVTSADGEVKVLANGNTPVTAHMEDLLGLSAKDWDLFVQSKQHSSAAILDFGAAALNRKVEEFAGVDLIDKVQAEAQRQSTIHTGAADTLAVSDEDMATAEAAVVEHNAAVQLSTAAAETATQLLERHGEFTQEKPASSAAMREQLAAVVTLSNKMTIAEVQLANTKQRVDEAKQRAGALTLQDDQAITADLEGMKTSGTALRETEKTLTTELASAKQVADAAANADLALDIRQKRHNDSWVDFEPDEVEGELNSVAEYITTQQADIARETEEVGRAKAKYENLAALSDGAVCPTCNRAKEDHDPVKLAAEAQEAKDWWDNRTRYVAELKKGLVTFQTRQKELTEKVSAYEASIVTLDAAINADKAAKEALKTVRFVGLIEDELAGTKGQLEQSLSAYAELQAKLRGVTENNRVFHVEHSAVERAEAELAAAEAGLKTLNDELEALPEPPTDEQVRAAEAAETAYQTAHSQWRETKQSLQAAVTQANQEVKHRTELLKLATEKLEQLKKNAAMSLESLALAKKYQRLVQFLRERRQQYLKEVWDTVMGVGSKLVRTASKDLITQISNDEGEFSYVEEGISAPTASASGAQKAMIGVSLRVGLARALYGKDSLLIFDEPTADCREHNAASLAAMIAGSAKQVLLITHRETDQALAENIVNVGE